MSSNPKEVWQFRELLLSMVERELRIRYKNSIIGIIWSLLNPLIVVLVLTLVFKFFKGNETPNLSAYILAAYLPYMFFQMAVLDSAQSILQQLPLIKKIYFPRELLPLSTIIANFLHFLVALGVFFVYLLVIALLFPSDFAFSQYLWVLPILLVINLALAMGVGFIVSALNTFYEDVKYIVTVLLYLLFFLSPIFYFAEDVWYAPRLQGPYHELIFFLFNLNPIAALSTAYRKALLPLQPVFVQGEVKDPLPFMWDYLALATAVSFGLLFFGYWMFNRLKWKFVERP
jgi:ABC-type polysaccharide/polyol phosphate export permease